MPKWSCNIMHSSWHGSSDSPERLNASASLSLPCPCVTSVSEVQNGHNEVRRYLQSWKLSGTECFVHKHVAFRPRVWHSEHRLEHPQKALRLSLIWGGVSVFTGKPRFSEVVSLPELGVSYLKGPPQNSFPCGLNVTPKLPVREAPPKIVVFLAASNQAEKRGPRCLTSSSQVFPSCHGKADSQSVENLVALGDQMEPLPEIMSRVFELVVKEGIFSFSTPASESGAWIPPFLHDFFCGKVPITLKSTKKGSHVFFHGNPLG